MLTLILLQIILIALNAVFACAEIAVLSINDTKLERIAAQGDKRAKRLFRLTREPAKFLSTIQVAITLSGFLGSAFAADNFSEPLVDRAISAGLTVPRETLDTVAVILITLVLSYFTLVFGELVPKRMAMKRSEELGLLISGLISAISVFFKPIVWLLSISTNAILRLIGIDPNETDEQVSEEDIRMLADAGSENGAIDKQENRFIQNIFEFDDLTAKEIVVHRKNVTFLWAEDEAAEWDKTIHSSRHTLYPVCQDTTDNVVGILNTKDYFRLKNKTKELIMAMVKPAYFVPETIRANILFQNMKKTGNTMAIVLDEHGGMTGIITLNDLIEKLVGDLTEDVVKKLADDPHIKKVNENTWQLIGNVELHDIEQVLEISIDKENVDTFTGLIFKELGMVPHDGKHNIELAYNDLHIYIDRIADHRIISAMIRKMEL